MNSKTEHTPTPWGVALDTDGFTNIVSPNADGTLELMIAECYGPQDIQEANAAFIVEACNQHSTLLSRIDALRAGLEKLVKEFDDLDEHRPLHAGCIQCTEGATPDRYRTGPCAYHAARALLEQRT
ncbi:MAG TPA: hypothetical protein VFP37_11580 [Steroidobacteraceae bacterium]|nr:hypothetical protein [Steroidobacteraceae bacterium]